ncbi:MAG: hypothetical protein NVS3B3_16700 [Aquirhabdus sp.]
MLAAQLFGLSQVGVLARLGNGSTNKSKVIKFSRMTISYKRNSSYTSKFTELVEVDTPTSLVYVSPHISTGSMSYLALIVTINQTVYS